MGMSTPSTRPSSGAARARYCRSCCNQPARRAVSRPSEYRLARKALLLQKPFQPLALLGRQGRADPLCIQLLDDAVGSELVDQSLRPQFLNDPVPAHGPHERLETALEFLSFGPGHAQYPFVGTLVECRQPA